MGQISTKELHIRITFRRSSGRMLTNDFEWATAASSLQLSFRVYVIFLNLVVCILLRVLDQVQGMSFNVTLFQ
jgi:hypothetical protein